MPVAKAILRSPQDSGNCDHRRGRMCIISAGTVLSHSSVMSYASLEQLLNHLGPNSRAGALPCCHVAIRGKDWFINGFAERLATDWRE